jgi:hypothetical protein
MKRLIKPISFLLAVFVLAASFGISITNHVCLVKESSPCIEDESCCDGCHDSQIDSPACCEVKCVYVKASFISSVKQLSQQIFTPAISLSLSKTFFSPDLSFDRNRILTPPLLYNRTILLSSSKLSV